MERLTDPAQGYCEMYCKKYGHCFGDPGDCIFEKEIAMYDALKSIEGIVPFDRLLELALADKEDRLVALPCKVGDTVYAIRPGCEICPFALVPCESEATAFCGKDVVRDLPFAIRWLEDIGKRYFLTREEAEAALTRERKDGEG